jgi:hypothetical protein
MIWIADGRLVTKAWEDQPPALERLLKSVRGRLGW